jgi:hypothetical protein
MVLTPDRTQQIAMPGVHLADDAAQVGQLGRRTGDPAGASIDSS